MRIYAVLPASVFTIRISILANSEQQCLATIEIYTSLFVFVFTMHDCMYEKYIQHLVLATPVAPFTNMV